MALVRAYKTPFLVVKNVKHELLQCSLLARACSCLSAKSSSVGSTVSTEQGKSPSKKNCRKKQTRPPSNEHLSWEERLADVVTPLWRLSYNEQLELKQRQVEMVLCHLSDQLSQGTSSRLSSLSLAMGPKLPFPVQTILPSPVREGYRNKSNFSVNFGADGNPKTVGNYVGTGRKQNIVCVGADHLLNIPEEHKLVARCYQDFIRLSPLQACILFHDGGHWREITVRSNAEGHTMAIVYFHPQTLSPSEKDLHKAALVDYFTRGPGAACHLHSLYFQESSMTRCSHEQSPYQLLHGQPHIYEEVLGFKFRISPDAFFQVNRGAAEVLYSAIQDMCFPEADVGGQAHQGGTLLDICCGTGAIGITMSPRVHRVIGVELIEQAVEDARHNAALNNVQNCDFLAGKAEVVVPGLASPESPLFSSPADGGEGGLTAVVNPARAGLHPRVVRALRNQPAIRRLVYISCKPEGEAMRNFRELCCAPDPHRRLTGEAFSPRAAVPVDMFPHTPHCELVLLFER